MNGRTIAAFGAMLVVHGASLAQPQTQAAVSFTLQCYAATPITGNWSSGVVIVPGPMSAPNQGALLKVVMTYSPLAGGPLTWDPTVQSGSSGLGSMAGFWSGCFDLINLQGGGAGGLWSDESANWDPSVRRHLNAPFSAGGGAGEPSANGGRLRNVQPAQLVTSIEEVDPANGIVVWQGLWIPANVTAPIYFAFAGPSVGVWPATIAARDNNAGTLPVALQASYSFGPPVAVYLVPSPSGIGLLVIAAAALGGPRRRCASRRI